MGYRIWGIWNSFSHTRKLINAYNVEWSAVVLGVAWSGCDHTWCITDHPQHWLWGSCSVWTFRNKHHLVITILNCASLLIKLPVLWFPYADEEKKVLIGTVNFMTVFKLSFMSRWWSQDGKRGRDVDDWVNFSHDLGLSLWHGNSVFLLLESTYYKLPTRLLP